MSQRPTLGVGITYFNEKELLTQNLNSLLSQPDRPDEIWVYDDASEFPARDYIPSTYPVRLVEGQVRRGGPAYGRNHLAEQMQCGYIHFQDADDEFLPGWCREIRKHLSQGDPEVILTEVDFQTESGAIRKKIIGLQQLEREKDFLRYAITHSILPHATTVQRALFFKIGGYQEKWKFSEDYEFHVRLATYRPRYQLCLKSLTVYRRRSVSRSTDLQQVWLVQLEILELLVDSLEPEYRLDAADMAAQLSVQLYQSGAKQEACAGFKQAKAWGPPRLRRYHPGYRCITVLFGQMAAEKVGAVYRKMIPEKIRRIRTDGR